MADETKVKAKIKKALDAHNAYYITPVVGIYGRAGVPDFIALVDGVYVAIEAKATANHHPRINQLKHLVEISEKGGAVLVINDANLGDLTTLLDFICSDEYDKNYLTASDHSVEVKRRYAYLLN